MNNQFIPYQRLELKKMSTEKIISIIRVAAKNYDDTSLILTPRIDQSGQAYYWTGLRYGGCTELEFQVMPKQGDRSIHPLFPLERQGRTCRCRQLHSRPDNDPRHKLAAIPYVPSFGILSRSQRLYQNKQRQDIPEQETDIPVWQYHLFTGNQGCIFDPTTMTVKQTSIYETSGHPDKGHPK